METSFLNLFATGIFVIFVINFITRYFVKNSQKKKLVGNFSKIYYKIILQYNELFDLVQKIKNKGIKIIGLDVEYHRGNKYSGEICLFQITLPNKQTYIIDMISIDKNLETTRLIKEIFENESIEKVMHACDNDLEWIYDQLKIITVNIFDTLEADQMIESNKSTPGLSDLLNKYKIFQMDKHHKKVLQKSDWKTRPLSIEQLDYAAQDSYYLIDLRNLMVAKLGEKLKTYENNIRSKLKEKFKKSYSERLESKANNYYVSNMVKMNPFMNEISKSVFQEIYKFNDNLAREKDINPDALLKLKFMHKISIRLPENISGLKDLFDREKVKFIDDFSIIITIIEKIKAEKVNSLHEEEVKKIDKSDNCIYKPKRDINFIIKHFACKGLAYENHIMLDPEGKVLCYCDSKKMTWYIERNLAKIVNNDPPTFQLNFTPKGRDSIGEECINQFYKKNCCIVCEKEDNYLRFNVVPSLYKQFFPDSLRNRGAHDIVLLCFFCMEKANRHYDSMKRNISVKYSIPLIIHQTPLKDTKKISKVISTARSIIKSSEMPIERKNLMKREVINFIKDKENLQNYPIFFNSVFKNNQVPDSEEGLSNEILNSIKDFDKDNLFNDKERKNFHGKYVVEKVTDFREFINSWRDLFLEIMKPKIIPPNWEEDYFYKNFINNSEKNLKRSELK